MKASCSVKGGVRARNNPRLVSTPIPFRVSNTKSTTISPRAVRNETPEQAFARRQRESETYSERVEQVSSIRDLEAHLSKAGSKLVVLEVQSEVVCQTGLEGDRDDEKEAKRDQWGRVVQDVHSEAVEKCQQIKHAFQRIARDCKDAVFLEAQVEGEVGEASGETAALLERLGVTMLPTLQFWKNGVKLYEHRGAFQMEGDIAEGVLYWDGAMAEGVKAGSFVQDVKDVNEVGDFCKVSGPDDKVLRVVMVSKVSSAPCLHMYPAVVALAKNFQGFASFARILVDGNQGGGAETMKSLGVLECPTFIMHSGGKEVARFVGASRAELISKILEVQQKLGVAPPPPPGAGAQAARPVRQKMVRKV